MSNKLVFDKGEFLTAEKMNQLAKQAAASSNFQSSGSTKTGVNKAPEQVGTLGSEVDFLASLPPQGGVGVGAGVYAVKPHASTLGGDFNDFEVINYLSADDWKDGKYILCDFVTNDLGIVQGANVRASDSNNEANVLPDARTNTTGKIVIALGQIRKKAVSDGGDGESLAFYQWRVGFDLAPFAQAPSSYDYENNCPAGAGRFPVVLDKLLGNSNSFATLYENGGIDIQAVDGDKMGYTVKSWMELYGRTGQRFSGAVPPDGLYSAPFSVDKFALDAPAARWGDLVPLSSEQIALQVASPDAYHWQLTFDKQRLELPAQPPAPWEYTTDTSGTWVKILSIPIEYDQIDPNAGVVTFRLYIRPAGGQEGNTGFYKIQFRMTRQVDSLPEEPYSPS